MRQNIKLEEIKSYVHRLFSDDATGHDFFHMKRVAGLAKLIAKEEGADPFICEAASWLHDVCDRKLVADPITAKQDMIQFLQAINISEDEIFMINEAIENVSFSKGDVPVSLAGKIVQDADRLDAIGAIGIARTFAYGGAAGQLIYHPDDKNTSIQHFYDKLLKITSKLNTPTAIKIARERHQFMETYLDQFFKEW